MDYETLKREAAKYPDTMTNIDDIYKSPCSPKRSARLPEFPGKEFLWTKSAFRVQWKKSDAENCAENPFGVNFAMEQILGSVKKRIDQLLQNRERIIVAIEGNCTAGKTTLADALKKEYGCNVIRMDDFFLRPEQRTRQRYAQPGGNIDYERFREEVLQPLTKGAAFSYRPFSCSTFTLADPVELTPGKLTVVEGTYSLHPYFGDVYDLKVFLSVTPEVQTRRILERPPFLHRRFFEEWIPMERQYFDCFRVADQCDLLL